MAVFKKRFIHYGFPYDDLLFDYINGNRYPTTKEYDSLISIIHPLNVRELYRGTDYEPIVEASVGNVLDYSNRCYS